jgi:hypothetical protein
MFRTSLVQKQEDHMYMQFLYVMFLIPLCKQSSRWKDVLDSVIIYVRIHFVSVKPIHHI